jgi:DNA invertase Pin-like site-specific DNA recombinase
MGVYAALTARERERRDTRCRNTRPSGCTRIYREKASGAKADRRELLKLLNDLAPGDMVTVTRIDRLARSTFRPVRHRQAPWTRAGSSGHWPNLGRIPPPAPGG